MATVCQCRAERPQDLARGSTQYGGVGEVGLQLTERPDFSIKTFRSQTTRQSAHIMGEYVRKSFYHLALSSNNSQIRSGIEQIPIDQQPLR